MLLRTLKSVLAALVVVALLAGCDSSDDADVIRPVAPTLDIDISANRPATSAGSPVTLTVRAHNIGTSRVVWGQGSSTCQLHAVVRVDGVDRRAVESRICVDDVVEQGLDAGETRTESFEWSGEALFGADPDRLPPGAYEVRGAAGDNLSAAIEIHVLD